VDYVTPFVQTSAVIEIGKLFLDRMFYSGDLTIIDSAQTWPKWSYPCKAMSDDIYYYLWCQFDYAQRHSDYWAIVINQINLVSKFTSSNLGVQSLHSLKKIN
jgi:hypothetical protein